jgi:uncharacterized protein (TIGR02246 family)
MIGGQMTNGEAQKFAEEWIRAWNRKDAEAVLAHFAEDAEFTSPKALAAVGRATVRSKRELAGYWHTALKAVESIRFTLERVINDETARRVVIVYVSELNGKKVRAAEFFQFDDARRVIRGEAMYGVAAE